MKILRKFLWKFHRPFWICFDFSVQNKKAPKILKCFVKRGFLKLRSTTSDLCFSNSTFNNIYQCVLLVLVLQCLKSIRANLFVWFSKEKKTFLKNCCNHYLSRFPTPAEVEMQLLKIFLSKGHFFLKHSQILDNLFIQQNVKKIV